MTDVIFSGKRYRLYERYYISTQTRGVYLHRAIWELHHGPIPDGHHIHHKDGDPLNNSIENLQALSNAEHRRAHVGTSEWHRSDACKEHLARFSAKAHEWHKQRENRKAQSLKTKAWFDAQPWLVKTCAHCGVEFKAKRKIAKYCTAICNQRAWIKAKK